MFVSCSCSCSHSCCPTSHENCNSHSHVTARKATSRVRGSVPGPNTRCHGVHMYEQHTKHTVKPPVHYRNNRNNFILQQSSAQSRLYLGLWVSGCVQLSQPLSTSLVTL